MHIYICRAEFKHIFTVTIMYYTSVECIILLWVACIVFWVEIISDCFSESVSIVWEYRLGPQLIIVFIIDYIFWFNRSILVCNMLGRSSVLCFLCVHVFITISGDDSVTIHVGHQVSWILQKHVGLFWNTQCKLYYKHTYTVYTCCSHTQYTLKRTVSMSGLDSACRYECAKDKAGWQGGKRYWWCFSGGVPV